MDGRRRELDLGDAAEGGGRWANLIVVAVVAFVIGAGVWLVEALLAARQADEYMSSGRRNCTPIEGPVAPPALIFGYDGFMTPDCNATTATLIVDRDKVSPWAAADRRA
jgi:hypothetical protein